MSKKKITLQSIKNDLANDPVAQSMPASMKREAILYVLETAEKNSDEFELTPKSKSAIIKYANSLTD